MYDESTITKFRKQIELFDEHNDPPTCDVRLCFDIVMYISNNIKANAKGILQFYSTAMDAIRPKVRFALIDGKGRFLKVSDKSFDLLPFWLSKKCAKRDVYGLILESGETADDMSPFAFHFYRSDIAPAHLRLILPMTADSADSLLTTALSATKHLKFLSGSAGIALNVHSEHPMWAEGEQIHDISRKYLGVDLGRPLFLADFMAHGIKTPNWLTFVGREFLDILGGREKAVKKLPPAVEVLDLAHGLAMRAGPHPIFGHVRGNEDLANYRAVWQAFRKVSLPDKVLGEYDGIGGTENTRRWFQRFGG